MKVKVTEAQVKKAVNDYLQLQQNMGKLIFLRLQCGSRLIHYQDHIQKMQFCEAGTADYLVLKITKCIPYPDAGCNGMTYCQATFLEIKSSTGKQSSEQIEFEKKANAQNCRYYVIRNADQLEKIFV